MRRHRIVGTVPVLALAAALAGCPSGDGDPAEPEPDALVINTSSLPTAVVGEAYSAGVDAEGGSGAYDWITASGSLPPGLAVSVDDLGEGDVVITGIPESAGSFTFVLRVESEDGQRRSRSFTIDVLGEPQPIGIETPVVPPALVGALYRTHLDAAGGDGQNYAWSVVGGTLPTGLTLAGDSIAGTPTVADTTIVVIRVTSGGFDTEKAFTLQVVANRTGTFDLTAAPVVPIPAAIQPSVDAAFARWQAAITGDVSQAAVPVTFFEPGACGGFGEIVNGTSADDIIILINIVPIDGPSNVLGQAGPCVVRQNDLPFVGVLTLDSDDLLGMEPQEVIDLVTHEISHVLGYGSLWEFTNLLGGTTADPRFTGPAAIAEWNALGGTGQVPVEETGGQGTAGSHWRESVFDRELLTGFAEMPGIFQPLSRVSIASLADLGYTVNLGAADAFALAPPMSAAAASADRAAARGWDVVLTGTIRRIEADGSVTFLRPEPR